MESEYLQDNGDERHDTDDFKQNAEVIAYQELFGVFNHFSGSIMMLFGDEQQESILKQVFIFQEEEGDEEDGEDPHENASRRVYHFAECSADTSECYYFL